MSNKNMLIHLLLNHNASDSLNFEQHFILTITLTQKHKTLIYEVVRLAVIPIVLHGENQMLLARRLCAGKGILARGTFPRLFPEVDLPHAC